MCVFLADSLDGDDESMRTCPKCGRANQPTRKYCIRCGGLLISVDQKPKTDTSTTPTPSTPEQPEIKETPHPVSSTIGAKVTTDDEWVKPSQVSRDRVRTSQGLVKPKSEMEKAREAFARADQVGIEETGEGIIETRMLRASEVQELMGDLESQRQTTEVQPSTSPPTSPTTPPPSSAGAPPGSAQPGPPTAGTPPGSAQPGPPTPSGLKPPPASPTQKPIPEAPVQPKPAPELVSIPKASPAVSAAPAAKQRQAKLDTMTQTRIPKIDALISEVSESEFLQDATLKDAINDLRNLHTELNQFNSDLESVHSRLESEVQDYWNLAEVKRINFESLEEQKRLAKQEWTDATKVYQTAEKRMKNEISSREKRIKDIEKRIEKTEDNFRKRVKELEKEKEKQVQSEN